MSFNILMYVYQASQNIFKILICFFNHRQPLTGCLCLCWSVLSVRDVYFNNKMHGKGPLTMLNQYNVSNTLLI